MNGISVFLLVIFVLFVVQAVGGYFQVKDYRRAVRRVHKLGNVGIGQKKGRLLSGNIVMIACDQNGVIHRRGDHGRIKLPDKVQTNL